MPDRLPASDPERPWVRLRSSSDTEGQVSAVLGKLEAAGQDVTMFRLMANSATCFRPFAQFCSGLIARSSLPADVREVVILDAAAARQVSYEWAEHEAVALRAGLTAEQIEAIRSRQDLSTVLSEDLLLAVDVMRRMRDGESLDPAIWERMVGFWGPDGAFDLVLAAGMWGALIPSLLTTFGLTAEDLGSGAIV